MPSRGIRPIPAVLGTRWRVGGNFFDHFGGRRERAHRMAREAKDDYLDKAYRDDDFYNDVFDADFWLAATSVTGTITETFGGDSGQVAIEVAGALAGDGHWLDNGNVITLTSAQRSPIVEVRCKVKETTRRKIQFGWKNANAGASPTSNYVIIENDAVASAVNWFGKGDRAGAASSVNLGVVAQTTTFSIFRIQVDAVTGSALFIIDGIVRGSLGSANVPAAATSLKLHHSIEVTGAFTRTTTLDYFKWWQDRPTS